MDTLQRQLDAPRYRAVKLPLDEFAPATCDRRVLNIDTVVKALMYKALAQHACSSSGCGTSAAAGVVGDKSKNTSVKNSTRNPNPAGAYAYDLVRDLKLASPGTEALLKARLNLQELPMLRGDIEDSWRWVFEQVLPPRLAGTGTGRYAQRKNKRETGGDSGRDDAALSPDSSEVDGSASPSPTESEDKNGDVEMGGGKD